MEDIKRILVVSRSTQYCRYAVDYGISLARKFGAELSVMHLVSNPADLEAVNAPDLFMSYNVPNFTSLQEEAKKRIEKIVGDLAETGFPVKSMVRFGPPADEVENAVRHEKIDLVVMLAHEEGRLEHLLFGGDTTAVIRRMPCSIMLVKKEPGPAA